MRGRTGWTEVSIGAGLLDGRDRSVVDATLGTLTLGSDCEAMLEPGRETDAAVDLRDDAFDNS